jgi:hypothetical protein
VLVSSIFTTTFSDTNSIASTGRKQKFMGGCVHQKEETCQCLLSVI